MERHRCKLCHRNFANGRALGGHMRSHMLSLPLPPKPEPGPSYETESWTELSSPPSSSSSDEYEDTGDEELELDEVEKGFAYKLRDTPKKSIKFTDVEFSSLGSSSVSVTLQEREKDLDRESDDDDDDQSESSPKNDNNPTKKRSRTSRRRRNPPSIETTSSMSPASSVSEVTSEEDVALCLMMLSRDNWVAGAVAVAVAVTGGDEKFKCYTCNKVFRSYQALGGHRASHKKLRQQPEPDSKPTPKPESGSDPNNKGSKIHECPVCFRVFASAQALGGHKRTHSGGSGGGSGVVHGGASSSNGFRNDQRPAKMMMMKNSFIDLNLPAPVDHDDEISQVSLSAVSDPHF